MWREDETMDSRETDLGSGSRCTASSGDSYQTGSWLRMLTERPGSGGCPSCGSPLQNSGMPACHYACQPLTLGHPTTDRAALLPRPTAKANQLAPSMAKWRSCRNLQKLVGRTGGHPHPLLWEWMMGFPTGWTELESVEWQ